ncbi:sporulation histidine kinase inhibitor Sda [Brevibacillus aydinogluensis]|jgi:developmental checkpoint coupling sporulation initiation to replication initiation|uniref:sporulation histidine kinase inhibitor Sda n=3 Tax=Brevibacillus TaxID=55080 RepID=UPI0035D8F6B2
MLGRNPQEKTGIFFQLSTLCPQLTHTISTWVVDIGTVVRARPICYNGHMKQMEVTNVKFLSDQMLIEVYQRAVDLQLDPAFIELLCEEIERRNLQITQFSA